MVRRILLNHLPWLFFNLLLVGLIPARAAEQPYFLLLNDGVDFSSQVRSLEVNGARVRQSVPPYIITADFPDTLNPSSIKNIKSFFTHVIPMAQLQSYGPMAVGAGLQWNRSFLNQPKTNNPKSMSSMGAMVAQESLPAPINVTAQAKGALLHCSWKDSLGSLLFQVQLSYDSNFNTILTQTKTDRQEINMPLDLDPLSSSVYVRVRSIDRPDPNEAKSDIYGNWSSSVLVSVSGNPLQEKLSAPILTSPVDAYDSVGLTVVVEWNQTPSGKTRIQVSDSKYFKNPLIDTVVSGQEFTVPSTAMHIDDKMFWRVKAWNENSSPWSSPRQFSIQAPRSSETDVFINPEAPK